MANTKARANAPKGKVKMKMKTLEADNRMDPVIAESCPVIGYQKASICVPVSVKPYAKTCEPITTCCGAPVVTAGEAVCPGAICGTCNFTISQVVCVAIPVTFGAEAEVGEAQVECIEASCEDICDDYDAR